MSHKIILEALERGLGGREDFTSLVRPTLFADMEPVKSSSILTLGTKAYTITIENIEVCPDLVDPVEDAPHLTEQPRPDGLREVVEALLQVLERIDESYREYGFEWSSADASIFQNAREKLEALQTPEPRGDVVGLSAEELRGLAADAMRKEGVTCAVMTITATGVETTFEYGDLTQPNINQRN